MFYTLLVSHGEFAPGLHTAVKMIAGDNPNVMSTGLKDGMGADELAVNVAKLVEKITPEDKLVVLADLMGGSPLTTTMNVIAEKEYTGICRYESAYGINSCSFWRGSGYGNSWRYYYGRGQGWRTGICCSS